MWYLVGDGAAVAVGSTLVDLLVEDKFHVGELHVDGWWVLKVGDLASVGSK